MHLMESKITMHFLNANGFIAKGIFYLCFVDKYYWMFQVM